jgi:hypothetical protein
MSLEIHKRDRHTPLEDTLSGSIATSPMRISGTLPDGTKVGPFELQEGETLVLLVEELAGARERNDQELAAAQGDAAASIDEFRATNRVRLHLAGVLAYENTDDHRDGHSHGLAEAEIPENPRRLHAMLHPEGLHEL